MSTLCSFVITDKQRRCRNPAKTGGGGRCWVHCKHVMFASKISHIKVYEPEPDQHRHPSAESWRRFVDENMFRCVWPLATNWFELQRRLWGMWRDAHVDTPLEMMTTLLWGRMRRIGMQEFSSRLVLVACELIHFIRSSRIEFDHIVLMVPDSCSAWVGVLCADIITPYLTQICWGADQVRRRPGERTLVIHTLDHLSETSVVQVQDSLQRVPVAPGYSTRHVLLCPYSNRAVYQCIREQIRVLPSCLLTETWTEAAAAYPLREPPIPDGMFDHTDMIYFEHQPFRGALGRILQHGRILTPLQPEGAQLDKPIGCLVKHVGEVSIPWDPRIGPYYKQIRFTYMGSNVKLD